MASFVAAVATVGLSRIACCTLFGVSGQFGLALRCLFFRAPSSFKSGMNKVRKRRSVQNRTGGRRGAAGDLREKCEATKRAGAASRLRVQCLSERPSISRRQRALRERRGHGTGRLQASWHWKCTCEPTPPTDSGVWTNGERRRDPADAAQSGRTTASSRRCGVKLPEYAGLYARPQR